MIVRINVKHACSIYPLFAGIYFEGIRIMDFKEYTAAARETAVYPEKYKCVYPAIGLVDEMAEFIEKYSARDYDIDDCPTTDEVIDELSDVMWYYAIYCDDNNLDMEPFFETNDMYVDVYFIFMQCGKVLGVTKKAMRDTQFPVSAPKVFKYLDNIAGAINGWCVDLGVTIEEVMEMNITKLRDRQSRGVIRGEGDNR